MVLKAGALGVGGVFNTIAGGDWSPEIAGTSLLWFEFDCVVADLFRVEVRFDACR